MNSLELDFKSRENWSKKDLDQCLEKEIFSNSIFLSIINSDEFCRLKNISFMGAIDYLSKGKKISRYEHSIDVAKLALFISKEKNYSLNTTNHLIVSALLHDIGHAPFSHSIEQPFKNEFGFDHHEASIEILLGKNRQLKKLNEILKINFDLDLIIDLISQQSSECFSNIFNSKFNIDTLDGIEKSLLYMGKSKRFNKYEVATSAFIDEIPNTKCLDTFWDHKDLVYKNLINSGIGAIADHLSKEYFYDNLKRINSSYFFKGEKSLLTGCQPIFRKFSDRLESIESSQETNSVILKTTVKEREYFKKTNNIDIISHKDIEDNYLFEKKYREKNIFYKIKNKKNHKNQIDINY